MNIRYTYKRDRGTKERYTIFEETDNDDGHVSRVVHLVVDDIRKAETLVEQLNAKTL